MVAYPDRGAGNDPKPFFFFFFYFRREGGGSLSQPRLNIFTVGNMRVMICLGQGGLCSLSASSVFGNVGLSVCWFVCLWTTLLKKLRTDWNEILWRCPG